jgi:hypothetical protein
MKYEVEMGSGAMIYIPTFIKIDSAIQKLMWGEFTDTAWRSHKPILIFPKYRKHAKSSILFTNGKDTEDP